MPQRKFRMFLSSKNTQTTAYHRFHAIRQAKEDYRSVAPGCPQGRCNCAPTCTRTQKVKGAWTPTSSDAIAGHVFAQYDESTLVYTYGTLLEAGGGADDSGYGIFEMSDCNSAFAAVAQGGNVSVLADTLETGVLLDATSVDPPIDTRLENCKCTCTGNGGRNPLIGWRKEQTCCSTTSSTDNKGTPNSLGYQMVLKNVQSCCKPPRLKMIQNRAASSPEQTARNNGKPYSVSGKIDRNYNYNYRQYLKKRCRIADYDNRSGGRQRTVREPPSSSSQKVLEANCCTTTCCKCVFYATYQISWNTNNSTASDTLYDAYGNSGVIQGPSGEITTFKMDCVLFARSNGNPLLWNDVADIGSGVSSAAAKFIALLSVRHGACHDPNHHIPSDILTYKRSNWGFRKQGAVDNSLYIATKKVFANPCCCVCYQQLRVKTNAELNNNDIGRYLAYGESRGIIVSFSPITPPPSDDGPYYSIWVSLSDCNKPFYDTQQGELSTNLPVAVKPKSVSNPWTRPATSCGNHSREEPGVQNPPLQPVDPDVDRRTLPPRGVLPPGGKQGDLVIPQ